MGEDGMRTMDDPMRMELTEEPGCRRHLFDHLQPQSCPGLQAMPSPGQVSGMPMEWPLSWVCFDGGATIDLAHGYLALVIPDPEFDNKGRGASSGESAGAVIRPSMPSSRVATRVATLFFGFSGWRMEETCRPAVDKVRPIPRHTLSKSHGGKVCRTALS